MRAASCGRAAIPRLVLHPLLAALLAFSGTVSAELPPIAVPDPGKENAMLPLTTTLQHSKPALSVGLTRTDLGFIHAFVASISVIIVSELGDKTFFIAAIMAMRYNRLAVLTGAMLALGFMTCLSVLFGYATTVIPRLYTYYISTALFAIFGLRMLRDGLRMSHDEGQEELEEVQAELKKKDKEMEMSKQAVGPADIEAGGTSPPVPQRRWLPCLSPVLVQAFVLTFLAEWGDRSQLATIVLSAREVSDAQWCHTRAPC
uniref:GDT1 family protein n=2 Tax=Eptatretus burgeri TaxID=7764 RepID=A0A8C4Q6G6_EPTBU